jgi:hypothetical protein
LRVTILITQKKTKENKTITKENVTHKKKREKDGGTDRG